MNETRQFPLEELTDGTPITYGVVQPGDSPADGVLFVRGGDIIDGQIDVKNLRRISSEISEQFKRTLLSGGEILVSLVGNPGQVALVPPELKGANIARQVALIRPNTALVNPKWLELFMRSPIAKQRLRELTGGAVQQVINLKELRSLTVDLPDLSIQHQVSFFIGSIENKIENLKQQNTTLEAVAQTLFRSWFVNFDPVHAKAAGQTPEGMSPELAALFPSEFVESELGMIPKGWELQRVSDVLTLNYGKSLTARDRRNGTIPVYGSGGVTGFHDTPLVAGKTVIVGRKGTVGSLYFEHVASFPIDTVFYVTAKKGGIEYLYLLLKTLNLQDMNTDAAVPGLNRENAYRLEVVVPSEHVLVKFGLIATSIFDQIGINRHLISTLSALRDELLPRLISGKLRIEEAEEVVAEELGSTTEQVKAA